MNPFCLHYSTLSSINSTKIPTFVLFCGIISRRKTRVKLNFVVNKLLCGIFMQIGEALRSVTKPCGSCKLTLFPDEARRCNVIKLNVVKYITITT